MSDLPRNTTVTAPLGAAVDVAAPPNRSSNTVRIWACIGGALLALTLYVWISWITGPYFQRVPSGPSEPPMYMKIPLTANAVVLWIGLPFALWYFIIRPWVRERRVLA